MKRKPTLYAQKTLVKGPFYTLYEDLLSQGGEKIPYILLYLHVDAVVVLAQDEEGRYILNREYRHPTGEYLLGCPGGRIEEQEDPLIAGKRELLEESGYLSEKIRLIGCSYPLPAISNQKIYFLWAIGCKKIGKQQLDPLESIETELKTPEALKEEVRKNSKVDGLLCTALWYKEQFS